MKKKIAIICSVVGMLLSILVISGYRDNKISIQDRYMMNAKIAYGSVDGESLDKTKVTYEIVIDAEADAIDAIADVEVVFGEDYPKRSLADGEHTVAFKIEKTPYVELSGKIVVDTKGMNKEEIDKLELIKGVRLVTRAKEEVILELHR